MARLCLLRHGQTDYNIQGRWQGHADIALNQTGLEQARRAADELAAQPITAIYASDLQRAQVTAALIAEKHALPVITDQRLREINMGAWEGQLISEIPANYPKAWAQWQENPVDSSAPGGESLRNLAIRVTGAITEICAGNRLANQILVVGHGLCLSAFICQVHGLPLIQAYDRIPKNAEPILIDWPLLQ